MKFKRLVKIRSFMKYNLYKLLVSLIPVILVLTVLFSCEDYLDVKPEDVLLPEQHYRDKYDADAAVRGIYGKLTNLAAQYVIMNELRADLMDVTGNAGIYLRQVNLHDVKADNPYADPQPFYSLINDCNDALENFTIMVNDLKLSREEYNQRYSDIAALRSWLYLQLVIHYGNVPYITKTIDRVDDLKMLTNSEFPVLSIEQMVDTLLNFMESIPYKDPYTDLTLRTSIDGYNTSVMFIDKEIFLGDLHLWHNNYLQAASYYKTVMERDIGNNTFDSYKVVYGDVYTLTNFNSGYYRYYYYDKNSAINNWPLMFFEQQTIEYYNEWFWVLYFHSNYAPTNPFIDLFSNTAGKYYLKPSLLAIDNWDTQVQQNEFKGDFRGNSGSYKMINGQPVIMKYIANYSSLNPFDKSGKWFLCRAGGIHLRFIEAANRDGKYKLAYSLLNNGIRNNYSVPDAADITYLERTNLPFPYDFDARKADGNQIPLGVRGLWHRNIGIRGRVYLQNKVIPGGTDSLSYIEELVIDEAALELAFEGQRWGDLVRIAIRRNDPAFLADRIYSKLNKAGYPEASDVRTKLLNRDNWFLPLITNK